MFLHTNSVGSLAIHLHDLRRRVGHQRHFPSSSLRYPPTRGGAFRTDDLVAQKFRVEPTTTIRVRWRKRPVKAIVVCRSINFSP